MDKVGTAEASAVPDTRNGTPRRASRLAGPAKRVTLMLTAVLLTLPLLMISSSSAQAVDSYCTSRSMNANKAFYTWVPREGVGATSWRTYMSISAADLCNHGSLRVGISFYDDNITQKGGYIRAGSVQFQRSGSSTWYYLPGHCCQLGSSIVYTDGGHLDLTNSTRITNVRVNTHLNFGGSLYAPASYTCNLVSRTCD